MLIVMGGRVVGVATAIEILGSVHDISDRGEGGSVDVELTSVTSRKDENWPT